VVQYKSRKINRWRQSLNKDRRTERSAWWGKCLLVTLSTVVVQDDDMGNRRGSAGTFRQKSTKPAGQQRPSYPEKGAYAPEGHSERRGSVQGEETRRKRAGLVPRNWTIGSSPSVKGLDWAKEVTVTEHEQKETWRAVLSGAREVVKRGPANNK